MAFMSNDQTPEVLQPGKQRSISTFVGIASANLNPESNPSLPAMWSNEFNSVEP